MPYIKPVFFQEQSLANDLVSLATKNGWVKVKTFHKASYTFTSFFYGTGSFTEPDEVVFPIKITEHNIIRNSVGDLFGIARICDRSYKYRDLPMKFKSGSIPDQAKLNSDATLRQELHEWIHDQWDIKYIDTSKIYVYMLDEVPDVKENAEITYPSSSVKAVDVLDIELQDYKPYKEKYGPGYSYNEIANQSKMMQSPITPISTRETGTNNNGWLTNWWPDSYVKVEGYIDNEVLALMIRADSAPAPFDNQVPLIPLYFGSVVSLSARDTETAALFAGTATSLPNYKYDATTPHIATSNILMPLNKKYPQYPGNGIDNIIVKRGIQGAYYQGYYFKIYSGPELMPPDRKDNAGRQFVSAWKNEQNDEYTYPPKSSYTDNAAVTRAHITHPDERDRGYLKKLIIASSVGIRNGTKLKLKKIACPDVFEYYKYFVADAVSPITKRPSVVSRPMGLAIYEKETN
ncbi:hypothetical protein JFL43_10655 [Viridibacillus sp. YIM B01967]|uniref:Major virion structural protein n=1 Tax=Viridibacillus soli TaxID=2798301 RepID=A0ABS1H8G1_9BACL|nr:hypothetical protein [Viridibacillus soli]MBK3495303.1 hypothetical protein [Viridibacillus soli]